MLSWTRVNLNIVLSWFLPQMNQYIRVWPCFCNSTMSGTHSSTFLIVWPMFLQLVSIFLNCIFATSAHFLASIFWSFFKPALSLVFTYSKRRCLSQFPSSIFQSKAPSADCRQPYRTSLSRTIVFVSVFRMLNLQNPHILSFHKFVNFPTSCQNKKSLLSSRSLCKC